MIQAKKQRDKTINRFLSTLQRDTAKAEAEDAALESFCPLDELHVEVVQTDHKQLPNLRNRVGFFLRKHYWSRLKEKTLQAP